MVPSCSAITIYPLRVELELVGPFHAPEYLGGLLRGGFGKYFRDLTCITRAPTCENCRHTDNCPYSTVFETPVNAARFPVLRKYPNAPHPFVLSPEMRQDRCYSAGSTLSLSLTLIGPGSRYFPHFLAVLDAMGREGRFGGRFRVRRVLSATAGAVVFDGGSRLILTDPPEWTWPQPALAGLDRMRIRVTTPLRLRVRGEYTTRPTFAELTQAFLRRVHLLRALYGDGEVSTEWMRPLLHVADGVVPESQEWTAFSWDRMSGRQKRKICMDGIMGEMAVRGDVSTLYSWYRLAEWIHVGSGTSVGMGRIQVEAGGDVNWL